jgi:hypothetical protein
VCVVEIASHGRRMEVPLADVVIVDKDDRPLRDAST